MTAAKSSLASSRKRNLRAPAFLFLQTRRARGLREDWWAASCGYLHSLPLPPAARSGRRSPCRGNRRGARPWLRCLRQAALAHSALQRGDGRRTCAWGGLACARHCGARFFERLVAGKSISRVGDYHCGSQAAWAAQLEVQFKVTCGEYTTSHRDRHCRIAILVSLRLPLAVTTPALACSVTGPGTPSLEPSTEQSQTPLHSESVH